MTKEELEDVVGEDVWPLIVAFVAEWLEEHDAGVHVGTHDLRWAAPLWREGMS